jgi:Protein of unknown function DUF262
MPRKNALPPIPTSREGLIARDIKQLRDMKFTDRPIAMPTWRVEIGQPVRAGGLIEPIVEELHDDGRLVVVWHMVEDKSDRQHPKLVGPKYTAIWWYKVFPRLDAHMGGQQLAKRNAWNHKFTTQISSIAHDALLESYRDNPDYQRGYVWMPDDNLRFIEAALQGRELGTFIFVKFAYPDTYTEVLDGKQRLNCLKDFMQGRFPYQGRLYYELSNLDRAIFESQTVTYVDLDGARMSRSELLAIFLEVNAAGVPQSEEHLDTVRRLYQEALLVERAA